MPKRFDNSRNSQSGSVFEQSNADTSRFPPRTIGIIAMSVILLFGGGVIFADWWNCLPEEETASYVGHQTCIACHQDQGQQWTGSHHDLAMDLAAPETVLADFEDATLTHHKIDSRMFREGEKYMIHTEGPDGKMDDFEIKYVFGVDPLQQYMVEFDRPADMPSDEIARLQVLRISWDTHRKEWFYLPPPDVAEKLDPDDDLHWTGIAQRWNTMCADCHSTNLQKNFDVKSRIYHTTFSEIDVSCEACHGPGSSHVKLANQKSLFWDRRIGYGLETFQHKVNTEPEIQACAQCHSRRRIVHPNFRPGKNFYDYYANELLQELTYQVDGQIKDEVYVHGSFLQSKMYHKGIRCTDCHNPHTAKLKHVGNKLCVSCHTHSAGKYDSPSHHHHKPGSKGASCVECHMPETTYMEVDARRDHSIRIPQPGLSVELGSPNACTGCHMKDNVFEAEPNPEFKQYLDWVTAAQNGDKQTAELLAKVDKWSADKIVEWFGKRKDRNHHFAHALFAARSGVADAEEKLIALAKNRRWPVVARATALVQLDFFGTEESYQAARESLQDEDPQIRAAAIIALQMEPVKDLIEDLGPLLKDPVRIVRTEAARVLAKAPNELLSGSERIPMQAALEELKVGLAVTNDRAATYMTLGIIYENLGDVSKAADAYETAIHVEPGVTGPRTNLAALEDRLKEQAERRMKEAAMRQDRGTAKEAAEEAMKHYERSAELRIDELKNLARDARLAPDNAAIQYRYGLSLYLNSEFVSPEAAKARLVEAEAALKNASLLEPESADFHLALALLYQKLTRWDEALSEAARVIELAPNNPSYYQLFRELQSQAANSKRPQSPRQETNPNPLRSSESSKP